MNLIEKGKELEYIPEPQLIEMARTPNGEYPQFLVLDEVLRRNKMRRAYENQIAKMNQPTTTVAEESVMELAGQGAVPMMDSLSSLSSSEGGLRSMAPTPMKSGGITEMQSGRSTALEQSFMPPGRNPLGATPPPAFLQSIKERYTDPDGTFNYSQALKDGFNATTLALIVAPEPTTTALGTGLRGLGTLLKSPFSSKAKDSLLRTFGRRQSRKDEGKLLPTGRQTIDDAPVPAGYFEGLGKQYLKESVKPIATRLSGLAALGIMNAPDESTDIVKKDELTDAQKRAESSLQDLQKLLDKPTDTTTTEKQGFASDDFLTLAQLGGILGGATNLGEAAMGIGNLAGQIQTTRREGKLEGLQGRVLAAQADKYEADIANMKPTQINAQLQTIENLIQAAIDSGNQDEVSELFLYQQLLNKRLLELQGIDIPTGGDILDKNRVA
jgi:hypothetical protein